MRGGRHFVRFPITKHDGIGLCALIGIVRPIAWENFAYTLLSRNVLVHIRDDIFGNDELAWLLSDAARFVRCGGSDVHCCAYSCAGGGWYSTNWGEKYITKEDWPGKEEMLETGEIEMLLDLVAGTLTLYKNSRRLGIVQKGLAGEYSWTVALGSSDTSIGIERGQDFQRQTTLLESQ